MPGKRSPQEMIEVGLEFVKTYSRYPTWEDESRAARIPAHTTINKYFGGYHQYWDALYAAGARPILPAGTKSPGYQPGEKYPMRDVVTPDLSWMGGEHRLPARQARQMREMVFADREALVPHPPMPARPVVTIQRW